MTIENISAKAQSDSTMLKFHPVADIFELLQGAEFDALCESIRTKGLLNPIVLHPDGSIVDGRNRYRACLRVAVEPRFATWDGKGSLVAFVVALNVDRRMLDARARALLGKQLEPLYAAEARSRQSAGGKTAGRGRKQVEQNVSQAKREPQAREMAARAARTNAQYISDLKRIEKEAPEVYAKIESGEIEIAPAKRMLQRQHAEQRVEAAAKLAAPDDVDVRECDMEKLLGEVRGVDLILTDPPYTAEHVPLYEKLARLARKALARDGILAVMMGLSHQPQIVEAMSKHIPYRWVIAYMMVGGQSAQVWNRKIVTNWKPVVLFGGAPAGRWLGDVVHSEMPDKSLHDHQQSLPGFMRLVERLSVPHALVCDPFVGTGTTAAACMKLHRRFIGCDTDAEMVRKARGQVALAARSGS